jgi:HK97 family phage major capsid protein
VVCCSTATREQLLSRKVEINSELRALRHQLDKPGATISPADETKAETLLTERDQVELALERRRVASPGRTATVRIGAEERLYRPDHRQTGGPSFIRDVYMSQVRNDPGAIERLARHGREVEADDPTFQSRAIGTSAVSGLVPPQYLTDLWAQLARAGRPVADLCTRLPLPPDGMSVNFSRITTGTTAAIQASEGASVSNTDADDTLLTSAVNTVAGQQTVSRQALERGVLVEEVLWADLGAAYNSALDAQCINGSGASGQHLGLLGVSGINAITFTSASPTLTLMWPKLADAFRSVVSQRFTGPTGWVWSHRNCTGAPPLSSYKRTSRKSAVIMRVSLVPPPRLIGTFPDR